MGETALYGLSSIVGRLVTFVFLTPYLTRRFVPEEMGVQTDLYAWAAFFMVLFSYRMETALFRYGKEKENRAEVFATAQRAIMISSLALLGLLVLFSGTLAAWLEYEGKGRYVVYFAFILALDALAALPFARLRLEGKARLFAGIKIANLLIQLLSLLFLLELLPFTSLFDVSMRIDYIFIANLMASGGTLLLLAPQWRIAEGVYNPERLRRMLRYVAPLTLAAFAGIINEVLDRVLLKILLVGDLSERLQMVGIYGSCYKIAIFMNLFTQAFNYAAEPFFFKQADREDARDLYADVAYLFALLGCAAFVGIGLFMDVAAYFVAPAYRVGMGIVPILLLANLFLGLYYNVAIWYKLQDKTFYGAYIAFFGAALTIVANLALIPFFGYLGAAWATLICYAGMLGLGYYWGQKYYPIPYDLPRIGGHIGAALGIYLLYIFSRTWLVGKSFWQLQGLALLFLLIYTVVLWRLEGAHIRRMLRRK